MPMELISKEGDIDYVAESETAALDIFEQGQEIGPCAQVKILDLDRSLGKSVLEKRGECMLVQMLVGKWTWW